MAEGDRLWTSKEAAAFLGIHPKSAVRLARLRRIPGLQVGASWRFDPAELSRWVSTKSREGIDMASRQSLTSELPTVPPVYLKSAR